MSLILSFLVCQIYHWRCVVIQYIFNNCKKYLLTLLKYIQFLTSCNELTMLQSNLKQKIWKQEEGLCSPSTCLKKNTQGAQMPNALPMVYCRKQMPNKYSQVDRSIMHDINLRWSVNVTTGDQTNGVSGRLVCFGYASPSIELWRRGQVPKTRQPANNA